MTPQRRVSITEAMSLCHDASYAIHWRPDGRPDVAYIELIAPTPPPKAKLLTMLPSLGRRP